MHRAWRTAARAACVAALVWAAGCSNDTWDYDRDGTVDEDDCGPDDPTIHPGAEEIRGNGIDEDCDGFDAPLLTSGEVPELEPNDAWPFQDLGLIGAEGLVITGLCLTAGHEDEEPEDPTGDLDVFVFEVDFTGSVQFVLEWYGSDDLDMIVYWDVSEETVLSYASDTAFGLAIGDAKPEVVEVGLEQGRLYAVQVHAWGGEGGAEYRLELTPQ